MLWVLLPDLAALLESSEAPAQGQLPVLLWAWLLAELCESEAYEIRCEMPYRRGADPRPRARALAHGGPKNGYVWAFVSHVSCIVGGWDCACVLLSPPSRHGCVSCVRSLVW